MSERVDIAVVGAGAAGLMAAIWAGRAARDRGVCSRIVAFDGARTLGAKVLVAGGGRCNVTHDRVDESSYAGSSRHAIRKVLLRFGVESTTGFFRELGVELKREETGKLFPTTDRARDVLNALLEGARLAGVEVRHPWRVGTITLDGAGFTLRRETKDIGGESNVSDAEGRVQAGLSGPVAARRVVLATGGMSLPKSGSDGAGYALARGLGHSITPRVFPALVPLTLPKDHFVCVLSGLTLQTALQVRSGTGKKLAEFSGSTLCAHFGLSGPCVLDISRYYLEARADNPGASLVVNWTPGLAAETLDAEIRNARSTIVAVLRRHVPERLAQSLCQVSGVQPQARTDQLTRDARRVIVQSMTEMPLPITGDRGFRHAEVTAGGVPLSEVRLETMESRACPGLHLCGEVCDVDGRIGGYNFQWAWASGFVAGTAAAAAVGR